MTKPIPLVVETAIKQNPGAEVTDRGVELKHANGHTEVLVSFKDLKKDFFDGEAPVVEVPTPPPAPVTETAPEAPVEELAQAAEGATGSEGGEGDIDPPPPPPPTPPVPAPAPAKGKPGPKPKPKAE